MELSWIAAVSSFALAMAGTPGPNNTMVIASGANYGFRRTLPLMVGITIGVVAIIMVVAAIGSSIIRDPIVYEVLKWVGLAYLLWLTWKIASAKPTVPGGEDDATLDAKPFSLMHGALFQLINPKLWVMVAAAVVTYGGTSASENPVAVPVAFGVIFGTATFVSTASWTMIGVGAARVLRTPRAMRLFNWTMAALLIASLIPVIIG